MKPGADTDRIRGTVLVPMELLICALLAALLSRGQCQVTRHDSACDGGVCYTLYSFDSSAGGSQANAAYYCSQQGLRLTAVFNEGIQRQLERVPVPDWSQSQSTWLAAKRSSNNAWVWTNNEPYAGCDLSVDTIHLCGALGSEVITAQDCMTKKPSICQRPKNGDCSAGLTTWSDMCVWIPPITDSWFVAHVECTRQGGSLVYIPGNPSSLLSALGVSSRQYWVGVRQSVWEWEVGYGANMVRVPIDFYHFDQSEGGEIYDTCIAMDLNYAWDDRRCQDPRRQFFCDDGTYIPPVPPPAAFVPVNCGPGVNPTLTTTTMGQPGSSPATGQLDQGGQGLTMWILIGVIILLLLGIILAMAVFISRRKHRHNKRPLEMADPVTVMANGIHGDIPNAGVPPPYPAVATPIAAVAGPNAREHPGDQHSQEPPRPLIPSRTGLPATTAFRDSCSSGPSIACSNSLYSHGYEEI